MYLVIGANLITVQRRFATATAAAVHTHAHTHWYTHTHCRIMSQALPSPLSRLQFCVYLLDTQIHSWRRYGWPVCQLSCCLPVVLRYKYRFECYFCACSALALATIYERPERTCRYRYVCHLHIYAAISVWFCISLCYFSILWQRCQRHIVVSIGFERSTIESNSKCATKVAKDVHRVSQRY